MNRAAILFPREPGQLLRPVPVVAGKTADFPAFMPKDRAAALELERLAWAEKCPTLARIARLAQVGMEALHGVHLHAQGDALGLPLAFYALDQSRLVDASFAPAALPSSGGLPSKSPEQRPKSPELAAEPVTLASFFGGRP